MFDEELAQSEIVSIQAVRNDRLLKKKTKHAEQI